MNRLLAHYLESDPETESLALLLLGMVCLSNGIALHFEPSQDLNPTRRAMKACQLGFNDIREGLPAKPSFSEHIDRTTSHNTEDTDGQFIAYSSDSFEIVKAFRKVGLFDDAARVELEHEAKKRAYWRVDPVWSDYDGGEEPAVGPATRFKEPKPLKKGIDVTFCSTEQIERIKAFHRIS